MILNGSEHVIGRNGEGGVCALHRYMYLWQGILVRMLDHEETYCTYTCSCCENDIGRDARELLPLETSEMILKIA